MSNASPDTASAQIRVRRSQAMRESSVSLLVKEVKMVEAAEAETSHKLLVISAPVEPAHLHRDGEVASRYFQKEHWHCHIRQGRAVCDHVGPQH